MSFDFIKNLFLTLCFSIIFFMSSSSMFLIKSNYKTITATIEKADCKLINNTNVYFCDLNINYKIDNNLITNQLMTKSYKKYEDNDVIMIDYDTNNYLNISMETDYKQLSLISFLSGITFLITFFMIYTQIKKDINEEFNFIKSFLPKNFKL